MEIKTTLAGSIDVARDMAEYDAVCKRVLSEKRILAWILKGCVKEFQAYGVREIAERFIEGQPQVSEVPVMRDETGSVIRGLRQEDSSPTEGSVFFNIYFYAMIPGTEESVQLIINVEAQNKFYPGYPLLKRGVFYGSRMISAQDGTVFTRAHYERLRKVYSIWICTNPPKGRENTITRYHMTEENLVGNVHEDMTNYDLLSVIMVCLGRQNRDSEGLLRLLGVLLSSDTPPEEKKRVLHHEFDIPMTQKMEQEVSLMCNLSNGVWERGIQRGIQEGIGQGIRTGRLSDLQNLMASTGWSAEEAMTALRIPEADRQEYAVQLTEQ